MGSAGEEQFARGRRAINVLYVINKMRDALKIKRFGIMHAACAILLHSFQVRVLQYGHLPRLPSSFTANRRVIHGNGVNYRKEEEVECKSCNFV